MLREVERNLAAVVDGTSVDPKVQVVLHYLRERNCLDLNGAIIFSQYRTTAEWVLEGLCAAFPNEPVALYAGGSASFVQRGTDRRSVGREHIKVSIQNGDIRLVCATDAACEGLNLQRLGAQVNVDLSWNPSRLEQRKGRVQRIGQIRDDVDILEVFGMPVRSKTMSMRLYQSALEIFFLGARSSSPMGSKMNGLMLFFMIVRRSGISHSVSRRLGHRWSCDICVMWPTIADWTGNIPSGFFRRVI